MRAPGLWPENAPQFVENSAVAAPTGVAEQHNEVRAAPAPTDQGPPNFVSAAKHGAGGTDVRPQPSLVRQTPTELGATDFGPAPYPRSTLNTNPSHNEPETSPEQTADHAPCGARGARHDSPAATSHGCYIPFAGTTRYLSGLLARRSCTLFVPRCAPDPGFVGHTSVMLRLELYARLALEVGPLRNAPLPGVAIPPGVLDHATGMAPVEADNRFAPDDLASATIVAYSKFHDSRRTPRMPDFPNMLGDPCALGPTYAHPEMPTAEFALDPLSRTSTCPRRGCALSAGRPVSARLRLHVCRIPWACNTRARHLPSAIAADLGGFSSGSDTIRFPLKSVQRAPNVTPKHVMWIALHAST